MDSKRPILIIPDLQIPYEHPKALEFCTHLKKHYLIPDENILNVGDEVDQFHGSSFDKDPDEPLSVTGEISVAQERLRQWGEVFPQMKVCVSNHGLRWLKKAIGAQIPSQLLRSYQDIFKTPEGWQYREEWHFSQLKHRFRMIHGMGYSGKDGARNAAIDSQISTVIGHLHAHAGISHIRMMGAQRIYGFNVGCLIREDAIAFKYGKYSRAKPCLGAGIIYDSGRIPIWIPLE